MRTLAVGSDGDITGELIDGIESLRQRVDQRLRFPRGEWQLNPAAGTISPLGRNITPRLAGTILTQAIRSEGSDEILDIIDITSTLNPTTRTLTYTATVVTVYGPIPVTAAFG